ncbi:hypothetical protein [Streptomyces noursei]|uniref:hypothetical protein n=1 Tax=Streptomyces noursei TaxID=1971 RepID=UPI0019659A3B|nr:hypothetical protein [Streptomyces noursei]QRX90177.1 hypothetical protein JNO44_04255 [Streptomyces noursei]
MSGFGPGDPFLAGCPARLAVELTPLGATLIDPIHTLTEWARANGSPGVGPRC